MRVREVWGRNDAVRVHAIEWLPNDGVDTGVPLVCMHGGLGNGWSFDREGELAASGKLGGKPRRLLAVDRRGMGLSEAPEHGYALTDFSGDLHASITAAGLRCFALFGHSLGVPIVLEYTLAHASHVSGLVLGDYPARYPALGPEWVDRVLAPFQFFPNWEAAFEAVGPKSSDDNWNRARFAKLREHFFRIAPDGSIVPHWSPETIRRMSQESQETLLWDRIEDIKCPVLVLSGTSEDVLLTEDDAKRYRQALPSVRLKRIPGADHMLRAGSDYGATDRVMSDFLDQLDAAENRIVT